MIRYYFLIGVFVIVISSLGCAANSSSEQIISEDQKTTTTKTPTPPPTSTATETPSPASVATPTYPPPTPTLPTTSTPIPPLIWSDEIEQVRIFDLLAGKWSPVENSLILHNCFGDRGNNKRIIRIDTPDVLEIKMSSDDYNCYLYFDMAWTPDGQKIVFTGPPPEGYPNADYLELTDVWLMGRNGENARPIKPGKIISQWGNLEFIDWADNHTIVYKDQSGNFIMAAMLDITTGGYYTWLEVAGGDVGPPNSNYLSATGVGSITGVMKRLDFPSTIAEIRDEHRPIFLQTTNKLTRTWMLEWLPGTNRLLIFENNPDNLETRLSLWDVNQNLLTILAPHGVDGQFSPNGRFLAYITRDIAQYQEQNGSVGSSQQADFTTHLHLFDMTQEQLTFSIPVTVENKTRQPQYPVYNSLTTFSPDCRYLTFFTPDKQGDAAPSKETSTGKIYLNVFDTISGQIVNSTNSGLEVPIWSPNSDKLVYRDELDDWVIFSIVNRNFTALTQSGGVRVDNLQWSFDGSYLSVRFFAKGDMPWERIFQTALFQVPEN